MYLKIMNAKGGYLGASTEKTEISAVDDVGLEGLRQWNSLDSRLEVDAADRAPDRVAGDAAHPQRDGRHERAEEHRERVARRARDRPIL